MLSKEELLKNYNLDPRNTGHPMAQFVLLRAKTNLVIEHLRANRKDIPAKRSMLKRLAKQKRILNYLEKFDYQLYLEVSSNLRQEKKAVKVS